MHFIKEYRVVNVWLGVGNAQHSFFVKEHSDRSQVANKGKVLFVGNIDFDHLWSHEEVSQLMRDVFSSFGDIQNIAISEFKDQSSLERDVFSLDRTGARNTRFAHVIFEKKSSIKAALQASDEIYREIGEDLGEKWGLAQLCQKKTSKEIAAFHPLYEVDVNALKQEVDEYMLDFEEKEQMALRERELRKKMADADGFTMVKSRKKRKREQAKRGSSGMRSRSKKKSYELGNFYRFQMREQKRNQLVDLRKKFEEDKLQVAKMKEARKFKPF